MIPPAYPAPSPAGKQPSRVQAVAIGAADDPDGGRRAGLHPRQHRVVHGEAGDVAGEFVQGLADGLDGEAGQAGGQVGGLDAGLVGRRHRGQRPRRSAGEQVADELGRGGVGAAAGAEGRRSHSCWKAIPASGPPGSSAGVMPIA